MKLKAELCGVCFPIIHLLFCLYRPLVRIFLWISFNGGNQVHHCQANTHNSDVIFCSALSPLRCWHGHGSCTGSCFPSEQELVHAVSQTDWCAHQPGFHCQMTDRMCTEFIHSLFSLFFPSFFLLLFLTFLWSVIFFANMPLWRRSVGTSRRRSDFIQDNIDMMMQTETWLRPAGDEAKICRGVRCKSRGHRLRLKGLS